ncbi:MAG: DegT/DnrJ/EryC1/StrS family aminotransferase [Pricia sp.]
MKTTQKKTLHERINVVKTYMPPLHEYVQYLQEIWDRNHVTNNGPLSIELERRLTKHLEVSHLQYVTNGTVALQLAIKALDLTGEIITTPYSYVATTNSIIWENCTPIFVDIDPETLCIDTQKIESKITDKTSAIMATHVYGIPCDVVGIKRLAEEHNLKTIYDAAHAFGVKVKGKSIFEYGTISTVSFHATKIFHTVEGGAVITNDADLSEKVFLLKTFGHRMDDYHMAGINAKNCELHAAIGLCNLNVVDYIIQERKIIFERYCELLGHLPIRTLKMDDKNEHNYAYFPMIFENHEMMTRVKVALESQNIYPRRYFYPSLNTLPFVADESCPISEKVSGNVLCLPFYHDLPAADVERIAHIIDSCF